MNHVQTMLKTEADKIRAMPDLELIALVSGQDVAPKSAAPAKAAVPKTTGVKAKAAKPKRAGAPRKAHGANVEAVKAWLQEAVEESGIGEIMRGTGLSRGAVSGALGVLRGLKAVRDNGGGKRDMKYKYVGAA